MALPKTMARRAIAVATSAHDVDEVSAVVLEAKAFAVAVGQIPCLKSSTSMGMA
jgi:hypothetical protein